MKMQEFLQLSLREQIDLLYKDGVYLSKQKKEQQILILYQYGPFYVELRYRKYRQIIERLRCFDATADLDPYLEEINIEELINSQF